MDADQFIRVKKEIAQGNYSLYNIKYLAIMAIKDCSEAIELLHELAEKENADAQREFGIYLVFRSMYDSILHYKGNNGKKENEAYYWWEKAARQGDSFSMLRMKEKELIEKEFGDKNIEE